MMFLWPRTLMNTCFIAGFIVFCFQVCRCWLLQLDFISFLSARSQSYWLSWCLSLVLRLVLWIQVSELFGVIFRFGDSTMRKSRSYEIVVLFVLLLRWHGLAQSDYSSSTPSSCQSGLGMVVNTNLNHNQPLLYTNYDMNYGVNFDVNFALWEIVGLSKHGRTPFLQEIIMQMGKLSFWDRVWPL